MDDILVAPQPSTFWASVREAIRGSHQDFTQGSIRRAVFLLAVPMVLEMGLESLFAVVDVFWVAHLGANSVAAVGLTEALLTVVYSLAIGVAMAATAMVARRIGEHDREGAAVAAVQVILLGVVLSLAMGVPGGRLALPLLRAMGATPGILAAGSGYTRIMLAACGVPAMLYINNAIFRGAGDASTAMRVLWLANAVNLALDPCLIFGLGPFPRLGVTGAAVATTIGRSIGVLFQVALLVRGSERIRILGRHLRLHVEVMLRLARVSATGAVQFLIAQASWIVLVRIISRFGANAVAGYTIALRVIIFVILPSWGMSNAAATLVGQNLGAEQPARAEQSVWKTGFYNMLFLGSLGFFFLVFAQPVVELFTRDPAVVPLAVTCLRILSYGNVAYAYGMVMIQAFNGAGDTVTPTLVCLGCYWLWEIPLAYGLAGHASLGPPGVYLSILIAEATLAGVSIVLFRRGRWKLQRI